MKLRRKIAILLAFLLIVSLPLVVSVADLGDWSGGGDYGGGSGSSSRDDCDGIGNLVYFALRIGCAVGDCAERSGVCTRTQVYLCEGIVVLILIAAVVLLRMHGRRGGSGTREAPQPVIRTAANSVAAQMRAIDPEFSEEDLKERVQNLFFRYCECRKTGDLSPIRSRLSDALYAKTEAELNALRAQNVTEYTERTAVLDTALAGMRREGDSVVITAELRTRSVVFSRENETGRIVSGSDTEERFRLVRMELARSADAKTKALSEERSAAHCPFCGASLSRNESDQCPYCDSVLPQDAGEWIVRSISIFG